MPLKKYLDYDGLNYLIQRIPRTKIEVTFDEVFAGETATCSMGTTTYTKTVPATEPYKLVFPINELGTWTIATSYLGDDYGTTIEVTAIGQTATGHVSYETTPEGATVLPTDDIQTWLACANITDKSYTTLAEVLADRETFETLIADSNACDYMARSTSWALVEGAVPTMTSDTTPSGVVTYSTIYSAGYEAYKAFDNDDATSWSTTQEGRTNAWVAYQFVNAVCINAVKITPYSGTSSSDCRIKNFKIQASNDNFTNDVHDLYTGIWNDFSNDTHYFGFNNTNSYTSYRLLVIDNYTSASTNIKTLQFYEADITRNPDAMALIGKYDYCSNALLNDATWKGAIVNSDYWESVCNGSVPKMTSNTAPEGECFSGSDYSASFPPYLAFDRTLSGYWLWGAIGTNNNYIGYKFPSTRKVYAMKAIFSKEGNPTNVTLNIQGSVDGTSNYVSLASFDTSSWVVGDNEVFVLIENPSNYLSYRILANGIMLQGSGVGFSTKDLQFYGRASAQTNIIHSAANDTIYMLENGSQVVLTTTDSNGIGILDFTQFMDGTYTLYSSVAKDPTNLSNDYSKSVRITKTSYGCTTEAYLMPDTIKTLYWFGYDSGLIEDAISANGWSWSGVGLGTPTHNTNDITLNSAVEGVKSIINGTHKVIVEGVTIVAGTYGSLGATPSKAISGSDWTEFSTSGKLMLSKAISNKYGIVAAVNGRSLKIHAWWYE